MLLEQLEADGPVPFLATGGQELSGVNGSRATVYKYRAKRSSPTPPSGRATGRRSANHPAYDRSFAAASCAACSARPDQSGPTNGARRATLLRRSGPAPGRRLVGYVCQLEGEVTLEVLPGGSEGGTKGLQAHEQLAAALLVDRCRPEEKVEDGADGLIEVKPGIPAPGGDAVQLEAGPGDGGTDQPDVDLVGPFPWHCREHGRTACRHQNGGGHARQECPVLRLESFDAAPVTGHVLGAPGGAPTTGPVKPGQVVSGPGGLHGPPGPEALVQVVDLLRRLMSHPHL